MRINLFWFCLFFCCGGLEYILYIFILFEIFVLDNYLFNYLYGYFNDCINF